MQVKAPWLTSAIWGAIIGSVATMITGFSSLGWVLGSTAERMAQERANTAVIVALTPACVARFMAQPNGSVRLAELKKIESWKQREFIEKGGWATPRGESTPNSAVADACVEKLLKTKV
jgi:hypothetical protein